MKNFVNKLINGKDNRLSGAIALVVVLSIALGCNCSKSFGDMANDSTPSNSSNSSSSNPFGNSSENTSTSPSTDRSDEKKPSATGGKKPTDGETQYLVRETMLEFNDAIQAADFTAFHSTISKQWQKQTTAEALKSSFQSFIDGQANFGAIKDMTADIEKKETRKQSGYNVLDVEGEYPTSSIPTTFKLSYVAEGSEWKLFKLEVYTGIKK